MTFKRFFSLITLAMMLFSALVQLLIDSSQINVTSILIIVFSTIITIIYLNYTKAYEKTPISALIIIGLLFTGLFGALLLQTLFWNPVTKYLTNPVHTFFKLSFYLLIALTAHYLYLSLFQVLESKKRKTTSFKSVLAKMGLYNIPSVYSVWILAIIGLCALILGKILPNTLGRAIFNFNFLIWFPFFIILYIYKFGKAYASYKKQYTYIFIFFNLIVVMGIAFNTRGLIVSGLVNLTLVIIILLLSSPKEKKFNFYARFLGILILLFGIMKPFSTFSDAMLLARSERGDITPIEMLSNTIDIYLSATDEELLSNEKYIEKKIYSNYDEDYIENGILTRFVLTKFHDNAYYYSSYVSQSGKNEVKKHVINKVYAIMPQPLLDILGIPIKKMEIMNTTTDILLYETTGHMLGGLKVPSTFVDLEVIFGIFSPIVFFGMSFLFFFIVEYYCHISSSTGLLISFPFFALASKYILFQLPVYGVDGIVNFLSRGFIEDILIFCLLLFLLNFLFKPFKSHT